MTTQPLGAPRARAVAFVLVLALGCRAPDAPPVEAAEPAGGVITLFTDSTELFLEHPALVVGEAGRFAAHLTDLTDFAPLRSGTVTLRFTPRDGGRTLVVVQDAPRSPGIYGPAPVFERPGIYDLTIHVDSPQARDSIRVDSLTVYATIADAPLDDSEDAGIAFLKEQQWRTEGFRTAFAVLGTLTPTIEVSGELLAAGAHSAEVVAPAGGLIAAGDATASPLVGHRVRQGSVLARMIPALGTDGASYADARARLREAEDEYERAKRLYAAEAIAERRLHEAEIRVTAAREALAAVGGGTLGDDGSLEIRAPISGVIVARALVPGSRVEAGAALFTIVDPTSLWLTAHVPLEYADAIHRSAAATFIPEGTDEVVRARRLIAVGNAIDPLSRTIPVTYDVAGTGAARLGAFARVLVPTQARAAGVIIPNSAILEEDGRPFAFVQTSGERYERRDLALAGSDGLLTLVRTGLREGDRVVTGAAYHVKLASLSTAVPAHGHDH